YQWKLNGTAIRGAVLPTYRILRSTALHAGNYTVTVTNTAGSATSEPLALALTP
ncbi:MAG: hypothetical protein RIQ79_1380, partial [Verrucomicrobiota bacterium]